MEVRAASLGSGNGAESCCPLQAPTGATVHWVAPLSCITNIDIAATGPSTSPYPEGLAGTVSAPS